jgi:DNA-binding CsgD family transcriptional regulator
MATEGARTRCRQRLERLADSSEDHEAMRRVAIAELRLAIGFERWCVPLVDPDTLISHTGVAETDHVAELPRLQVRDAFSSELNSGVSLAVGNERVGALSALTGGDLARSRRWRESLQQFGTGDELRVVAADDRGCWGRFDLWRDRDDRPFSADDARFLRESSKALGRALRRSTMGARRRAPAVALQTGVLVIEADLRTHRGTPAVWEWFRLLNPNRVPFPDGIPSLVWGAVGRVLAAERGENSGEPARIRVRANNGCWALIEAARLGDAQGAIAVSVHAATMDEVLVLLFRAHRLSVRERELVRLVIQGLDTDTIADRLVISRYTVQDHLTSIFRKVGVNSRLELLADLLAPAN